MILSVMSNNAFSLIIYHDYCLPNFPACPKNLAISFHFHSIPWTYDSHMKFWAFTVVFKIFAEVKISIFGFFMYSPWVGNRGVGYPKMMRSPKNPGNRRISFLSSYPENLSSIASLENFSDSIMFDDANT